MTKFWNFYNSTIGFDNRRFLDEESLTCSTRVRTDFAIVDVVFNSAFVTKLRQDVKTTFADKISNIGKKLAVIGGAKCEMRF